MITFACEQCGKTLRVTDEAAGKKARCPECDHRSVVPGTVAPKDTRGEMRRTQAESGKAPVPKPGVHDQPTLGPHDGAPAETRGGIPGYEVLGELGRGGMGVVYKARQQRPRRIVALKMVLAGEHASEESLARFQREAEAVAKLQHPNIVTVHEVGDHDGRPYFSLEYVEGGSLAALLEERALGANKSALLLHDVARGVQFAHKRGIIHRDLKPANVLLAPGEEKGEWQPKIADFGLAKELDEMASVAPAGPRTASGAVMGTPAYMAPEQAGGKKKIGPAADIYSLGAILYHCLTGRPPFEAGSMLDTLMKVATEEPTPPRRLNAKVPRDLETICLKCLEKEPERRYGSAKELADDLRRFLDGKPIQARPQGAFERLRRWMGRRKEIVYIAAGSLAAVVVVAGSFWALAPGKEKEPEKTVNTRPKIDDQGGDPKEPGAIGRVREAADQVKSSNNLKQIALAVHNIHDAFNYMPPAAICDPNTGAPLLSWRVALLPYLEEDNLYKQFDLRQAWDSPRNKKFLEMMPKVYQAPGVETTTGHTFYQVFTGPGTPFDTLGKAHGNHPFGRQGPRINDFTDGTSNTLLVVEAGKAVPWTKPEDIAYDARRPLPQLGGVRKANFLAAMADGSVLPVSRAVSETTLRNAITHRDGLILGNDWPSGIDPKAPQEPKGGPPGAPREKAPDPPRKP